MELIVEEIKESPLSWLGARGVPIPNSVRKALLSIQGSRITTTKEMDVYNQRIRWTIRISMPQRSLDRCRNSTLGYASTEWESPSKNTSIADVIYTWGDTCDLYAPESNRIWYGTSQSPEESYLYATGLIVPTKEEISKMESYARGHIDSDGP